MVLLSRDATHRMGMSVHPSVHLSDLLYCVKTARYIVKVLSPSGSPYHHLSFGNAVMKFRQNNPYRVMLNICRVEKFAIFVNKSISRKQSRSCNTNHKVSDDPECLWRSYSILQTFRQPIFINMHMPNTKLCCNNSKLYPSRHVYCFVTFETPFKVIRSRAVHS